MMTATNLIIIYNMKYFNMKYDKVIYAISIIIVILFLSTFNTRKDYNCSDFKRQPDAQNKFEKNKEDIYHLDKDGDYIACEALKK